MSILRHARFAGSWYVQLTNYLCDRYPGQQSVVKEMITGISCLIFSYILRVVLGSHSQGKRSR